MARCKACNNSLRGEWQKANREKVAGAARRWRAAHPQKAKEVDARWKRANSEKVKTGQQRRSVGKYGLSLLDRAELLRLQHCKCAVCYDELKSGKGAAIDHDHNSGKVRGILCSSCNTAIGLFKEDPRRMRDAIAYLERHKKA